MSSLSNMYAGGYILALTSKIEELEAENAALKEELERERIRLAACGVVALANTPDSAVKARKMNDEYISASCNDVARAVDKQMELRQQLLAAQHRIKDLQGVCRNVYEVWAGSEGIPKPETCSEDYLLRLVEQMRDEVKIGLTSPDTTAEYDQMVKDAERWRHLTTKATTEIWEAPNLITAIDAAIKEQI